MFRACGESNYALAVFAPSLDPNLRFHLKPTHPPCAALYQALQVSVADALHFHPDPVLVSGPQVSGLFGLRTWGVGTHAAPHQALPLCARTRIVLPFHISGGQCASCSRRTSDLETVLLSAIPVKRTAAASDELCSFGVSCLGSS